MKTSKLALYQKEELEPFTAIPKFITSESSNLHTHTSLARFSTTEIVILRPDESPSVLVCFPIFLMKWVGNKDRKY